jgi:hypothetical protein
VPKGLFRIDKVVNHREEGGETEYLVRWKGYDQSHDEWKKEQDITSAALDEYRERLKRTIIDDAQPCHIRYHSPCLPEKESPSLSRTNQESPLVVAKGDSFHR